MAPLSEIIARVADACRLVITPEEKERQLSELEELKRRADASGALATRPPASFMFVFLERESDDTRALSCPSTPSAGAKVEVVVQQVPVAGPRLRVDADLSPEQLLLDYAESRPPGELPQPALEAAKLALQVRARRGDCRAVAPSASDV